MSLISSVVSSADSALNSLFDKLGISANARPFHAILDSEGNVVAKFAITSVNDSAEKRITRHPLESGAPISDHSYFEPRTVTVSGVYSAEYPIAQNEVDTIFKNRIDYFGVVSRGRVFNNLVVSNVSVTSSRELFDSSDVVITFTEFLVVSRQTGSIQDSSLAQYQSTQTRGVVQTQVSTDAINTRLKSL